MTLSSQEVQRRTPPRESPSPRPSHEPRRTMKRVFLPLERALPTHPLKCLHLRCMPLVPDIPPRFVQCSIWWSICRQYSKLPWFSGEQEKRKREDVCLTHLPGDRQHGLGTHCLSLAYSSLSCHSALEHSRSWHS